MGFVTTSYSTEEDFAFIPYYHNNNKAARSLAAVAEDSSSDGSNEGHQEPELRVRREAYWSYCGPLLDTATGADAGAQLPASLHEWRAAALAGTGPAFLDRLLPFLDFVNGFVAENGLSHYWLTIRATEPTAEYDRPRWHTDDMFFDRSDSSGTEPSSACPSPSPSPSPTTPRRWSFWGHQPTSAAKKQSKAKSKSKSKPKSKPKAPKPVEEAGEDEEELCPNKGHQLDLETDWKVCTTLLGPSTMFIPAPHQPLARARQRVAKEASRLAHEHACTSIRCVGCASTAEDVRQDLGASLADLGRVQAAAGECSFFRIGPERGAVHSEPRMSEDGVGEGGRRGEARGRIFVNVVPGRREELERLMGKWGMEFPRSWWIAPSRASPRTSC
ncbi:hypothetical protein PG997_010697 [Apiospora hydei]|uniref:Uncharacterized protein n=1 Tax=Apiospora hydei TaxID=1337664 RepID=A0ABR1VGZ8_9PEZI